MANNRMILRCRACGEQIVLAKNFGAEWYSHASQQRLDSFFAEHNICGLDLPKGEKWDHQFELIYED